LNPKVHYRVLQCPTVDTILSQLNPVRIPMNCFVRFPSILILPPHLRAGLPCHLFPADFPTKIFVLLIPPCALHAQPISSFIWWKMQIMEHLPHCAIFFSFCCYLLSPNILLNTVVKDQVDVLPKYKSTWTITKNSFFLIPKAISVLKWCSVSVRAAPQISQACKFEICKVVLVIVRLCRVKKC
jgi:hypothetical protein